MKIRCPRCKGRNLEVTEYETYSRVMTITSGAVEHTDRNAQPHGDTQLSAACQDCSKHWKLRKATRLESVE